MGTLRFILALSVAYGHLAVPLSFPTADVAVQSFFVISGFYMALVLNEKYGAGSYWLFVSNRLLRLWPTYFVVLILSLGVADNWQSIAALDWLGIWFLSRRRFRSSVRTSIFFCSSITTARWLSRPITPR